MSRIDPGLRTETLASSWSSLREAGQEARKIAEDLPREQLWWRPDEEEWSVGECLDHLVRTGEAYLEALDETIQSARRRGLIADGPHRRTLTGRWLVRILEPPPGLKVPAPAEIRPRPSERPEAADPLERYLDLRPRMEERLLAADGLDLYRARVTSPFFRWIRFDLGSAFDIVAAHERRHLWQARQVRQSDRFPEA